MNTNKYVIASLGAAVFIFIYGWLVYGLLLIDYVNSISPAAMVMEEGSENMMYIALGCLIQGFGLGLIYTKGHEGKGPMEGVRFGLFVGIFLLGMYVLMSGISPYTMQASITFAIIDTIMYMGAGVVLSLLYKK